MTVRIEDNGHVGVKLWLTKIELMRISSFASDEYMRIWRYEPTNLEGLRQVRELKTKILTAISDYDRSVENDEEDDNDED